MRRKRFGSSLGKQEKSKASALTICNGVDCSRERGLGSREGFFHARRRRKYWRGLKPWKTRYGIREVRSRRRLGWMLRRVRLLAPRRERRLRLLSRRKLGLRILRRWSCAWAW